MLYKYLSGEFIIALGNYPKVEKLKITNNIKNRIIFIFFIAVKIFILTQSTFSSFTIVGCLDEIQNRILASTYASLHDLTHLLH